MTAWPPNEALRPVPLEAVGPLTPEEVLYEFDGPCIFSTRTAHGTLVLAYLSEELEDESLLRYVVSTTARGTLDALKGGTLTVHEALCRGSIWLVDLDLALRPQRAFAVHDQPLPEDALPTPGTMLWPTLEPLLSVRLCGDEIQAGRIPAGVFTQAAEIASRAFKPVFEWAAQTARTDLGGRPPEWLRRLYALPTQRLGFRSLEVAFGAPQVADDAQPSLPLAELPPPTAQEIQQRGWQAVREGLAWTASADALPSQPGDEEKWLAVLEAMKRLAPSGPVDTVEVWGQAVSRLDAPFTLNRKSTQRIRGALTQLKRRQGTQLRLITGRVRDLDRDKLTLIVRGVQAGSEEVSLVLDDERLLELALEVYNDESVVSVVARSDGKRSWVATEIELVGTDDVGNEPTR